MIKKIIISLLLICICFSVWYLYIKTYDYEVEITVKTNPGTIYHSVLNWNESLNKGNTVTTSIQQKTPFQHIIHSYNFEAFQLDFDWNMKKINDSITKVIVGVNSKNQSISTRIKKLTGTSPVKKLLDREFSGFNQVLLNHIKQFAITVDGEAKSPETYVAYVKLAGHQNEKANKMISKSTYINTFLKDHDIKLKSNPFVEITHWNMDTSEIEFNFCFPIEKQISFPYHKEIKYKKVITKKSIKATFIGNYSYTDNAWYALYEYMQKNDIARQKTITEVFLNNPHTSAKDSEWEAHIYMEIE